MKHNTAKAESLIPQNLIGDELIEWLKLNASEIHDGRYFRPFTLEELHSARELFADESVNFNREEEEVKEKVKDLKETLKEQKGMLKGLLQSIQDEGITQDGKTYIIHDYEARQVYTYDNVGNLTSTRKLLPSERQTKVMSIHE